MAYNTVLEFDNDAFPDMLKEFSAEKLQDLLRICVRFEEFEKALAIQQELKARAEKQQKN